MFFFILLSIRPDIPTLFVLFCLAFLALVEVYRYVLSHDYVEMIKDEGKWHIVVEKQWVGEMCLVWLQEVEE